MLRGGEGSESRKLQQEGLVDAHALGAKGLEVEYRLGAVDHAVLLFGVRGGVGLALGR